MYSRVYIEITNICNMNCSFCHGHSRAPYSINEEEYAHILRELKGKTKYIYHHLMGEPLIHPLLPKFIQKAIDEGFRPMITTNGTMLDKAGNSLLIKGLHKINISLHSFEKDSVEEHENYIRKVAAFSKKAHEIGILISLRLWNNGFDEDKNDTAVKVLKKEISGEWYVMKNGGYHIRNGLFLEWGDRFEWPDENAPEGDASVYCHGLSDHFGILCDGTVVPCCLDSEGVINLGNVFNETLSDILASPRAKAITEGFRNRKTTEDLCRRCGYARKF